MLVGAKTAYVTLAGTENMANDFVHRLSSFYFYCSWVLLLFKPCLLPVMLITRLQMLEVI